MDKCQYFIGQYHTTSPLLRGDTIVYDKTLRRVWIGVWGTMEGKHT